MLGAAQTCESPLWSVFVLAYVCYQYMFDFPGSGFVMKVLGSLRRAAHAYVVTLLQHQTCLAGETFGIPLHSKALVSACCTCNSPFAMPVLDILRCHSVRSMPPPQLSQGLV